VERWREVAARQWGAVSRDQLRAAGLSDDTIWRLLKDERLVEVLPRVYGVGGAASGWHQSLMAACLWGGDSAVASHRSAAALWCFDGFREEPLEITSPKQKKFPGRFSLHRGEVAPAFATRRQGIPVTNPLRTVRDLVFVLNERRSNQLVDEALRKGLVSVDALVRSVEREAGPGRRGVGALRRLLEEREPGYLGSASELQARVRRLLIAAGVGFVEEYEIADAEGGFVARVDFLLQDAPVVIEADGRATHSSKVDWEYDLDRRNRITARGYAVIHVTWNNLRSNPDALVREILRARDRQFRRGS
jgi:predicted DNA-binding transcriptional regulator AlpA